MKHLFALLGLIIILVSCDTELVVPAKDKMDLLSGGSPQGKQWVLTSFKTISNYCTSRVDKFETTESWDSYPEYIKDNITTIYPNGTAEINEGRLKYSDDSPQIYSDQQFWTLNQKQDSVSIVDYVGRPSIRATWKIEIDQNKIVLTYKEVDIVFQRSSLTHIVTFRSAEHLVDH